MASPADRYKHRLHGGNTIVKRLLNEVKLSVRHRAERSAVTGTWLGKWIRVQHRADFTTDYLRNFLKANL